MNSKYVLVTSARNESKNIKGVIDTVKKQTILPIKWVIINDNSTDNTSEILRIETNNVGFIEVIYLKNGASGNFSSKVFALKVGFESINSVQYDYIGILDADITLQSNYYEEIIHRMEVNKKIGIGGGVLFDYIEGKKYNRKTRPWSVPGAIQFFRKQCFDEIGGFLPLPLGSEDSVAEITARMKGWEVITFNEIEGLHHRLTGLSHGNVLRLSYINGYRDYSYGCHPVFEIVKCLGRIYKKPYLIGAFLRLFGYFIATVLNKPRLVSREFIRYIRKEQIRRLFEWNINVQ